MDDHKKFFNGLNSMLKSLRLDSLNHSFLIQHVYQTHLVIVSTNQETWQVNQGRQKIKF